MVSRYPSVGLNSHLESSQWIKGDVSYGCEPNLSENLLRFNSSQTWLPFFYSYSYSPNITVFIRHYQDPYISAADITSGCSSTYTDAHSCFGKSRKEELAIALSLVGIGVIASLIEILVGV